MADLKLLFFAQVLTAHAVAYNNLSTLSILSQRLLMSDLLHGFKQFRMNLALFFTFLINFGCILLIYGLLAHTSPQKVLLLSLLDSELKIAQENLDDVFFIAEASDIDRSVAVLGHAKSGTLFEKQFDHKVVVLVSGPMQRRHADPFRRKVHISALCNQYLDTLLALHLRLIFLEVVLFLDGQA